MTDELFQIDETLSPRLKWIRENRIEVVDAGIDHEPGDTCPDTGQQLYRYHAFLGGKCTKTSARFGSGDTEDEAIVDLAKKLNLKLWNE